MPGPSLRRLRWMLGLVASLVFTMSAHGEDLPEYRLKTAFAYNFVAYTEWPASTGNALNLCIYGTDPFGKEVDGLQGKVVAGRTLAVLRKAPGEPLKDCQVVFITASTLDHLPRTLESLRGRPVLTIADSAGAMRRGVVLNMNMAQGKVSFEANLQAARAAGLDLSSKLLRLATEVQQ